MSIFLLGPDVGLDTHVDDIVRLIEDFARQYLNDEYLVLCRRMAGVLARKRPSPIVSGKPESWACGIIRAVGWANFLDDPSQTPHVKMTQVDQLLGVSTATGQAKGKAVRDLLKLRPFDPERDHYRGRPDAPLVIVEYGDFECPFCSRATGSVDEVLEMLGDEVVWAWRHLPQTRVHPHAIGAALAAEAAARQGRFLEYGTLLFRQQDRLER